MAAPSLRIVRPPRRALTAASQPVDPQRPFRTTITSASADWQDDAWNMLDAVPELRYYTSWRAAACSRVRLIGSDVDPQSGLPTGATDNTRVASIVNNIAGGALGQTQLIRRSVECLTIPGEVWVAVISQRDTSRWLAVSKDEYRSTGQGIEIDLPEGDRHQLRMPRDSFIRIWNPRPRRASEPDSAVRSCLTPCHEIVRADRTIANAARSRLIGAGVMFVPQEMSLPPVNVATAADPEGSLPIAAEGATAVTQLQELLWQFATRAYDDDQSMEQLIPIFAQVPGDQVKNIFHWKPGVDVAEVQINIRNNAVKRLAIGLDVSPERLQGLASTSNHWCSDTQTEILTRRGWLNQSDLQVGDFAFCLDHTTGQTVWTPVKDIYRAHVRDEPMLSIEANGHSSLSTAGHRWPVVNSRNGRRGWTTSGEGFLYADRIPAAALCASLPTEPKYTDSFVRLAAAYMSDGARLRYISGTEYVRICKFDATEIMDLRAVCRDVFGRDVSEHHHPTRTRDGVAFVLHADESQILFDVTGEHKALTLDFIMSLTQAQLHLFLAALIEIGDGILSPHGARTFFQVEPSRLDAIELAAILAGYRVTRGQRNQQTGFGTTPLHWVRVSTSRKWTSPYSARKSWQAYSGIVWCPTTETGTWMARRNGTSYFTGNSFWGVGDEDVQLHVSPVMETLCTALYTDLVSKVLDAEGIDSSKYMLWYDASELTRDPDKSQNANTAFSVGAVNAEAYRDMLGLPADAGFDYSTMEGWRAWAQDHVSAHPELLPILAPLLPQEIAQLVADANAAAVPPVNEVVPPDQGVPQSEPQTENQPPPTDQQAAGVRNGRLFARR